MQQENNPGEIMAPPPPPPITPPPPPAPDLIDEGALGEAISAGQYFEALSETDVKPSADSVINQDTGAIETPPPPSDPEPERMTKEQARTKTERFIQMRDMLQSRGLAMLASTPDEYEKYKLDSWEFDWLVDLYTDTVEKIGHIPAWLEIVLAEAVIMGPKIKRALDIGKLERRNREQAAEIARLQAEIQGHTPAAPRHTAFNSNKTPEPIPGTTRPDAKKYWTIDESGYFDYDTNGNYIKQPLRTAKADLSNENYQQLVKYNGEEKIKRVFKID